jgi:hypothetical protein
MITTPKLSFEKEGYTDPLDIFWLIRLGDVYLLCQARKVRGSFMISSARETIIWVPTGPVSKEQALATIQAVSFGKPAILAHINRVVAVADIDLLSGYATEFAHRALRSQRYSDYKFLEELLNDLCNNT